MDNNDRRQRHNPHPGSLQSAQTQYPMVSAPDRFSQAPQAAVAQPPTSAPPGSRIGSQPYYAFSAQAQAQAHPQYAASQVQPSYGAQEYASEQPQRVGHYAQYGQNVMYNVPGAHAPASGQSQYESVQPYQQGRDSAIGVLNSGFSSVPQPAGAQYYMPGQEGSAGTAPAAMATQSVPSQYSSLAYTGQHAPGEREPLDPQYSTPGMADAHHATSQDQFPEASLRAGAGDSGGEYEQFFVRYQDLLKRSNESTKDGRLRESAETLLQLSGWLFQWAETIGLAQDDPIKHSQKLSLWKDFNNSWLVALQKQKATMQEIVNTGHRAPPPQSLIDETTLDRMGDYIVQNCDLIEKHGLVDYEMGVWEEQIIAMIESCLDLWGEVNDGSRSSHDSHAQPASRRRHQ